MSQERETSEVTRHAPRWLHVWAVVCVAVTAGLLILGGLVTSKKVGMADPVWPTEPWFLFGISWEARDVGFLIEHTHRLAGFTVGGLVGVLAIGAWWTEKRATRRWLGVLACVVLLAGFGQFHGEMTAYTKAPQGEATERSFPVAGLTVTGVGLLGLIGVWISGAFAGSPGWRFRGLTILCLVGVMIQGLLGGFRVWLNALAGTDLAAGHGVFAQLVFCLLLYTAVFSAPRDPGGVGKDEGLRLWWAVHWLVIFAFVQLIWGAWLRHQPGPLAQRLHLLTAFLVIAAGVWLIRAVRTSAAAKVRLGLPTTILGVLFAVQVALGVEAWLGKFGTGILPELEQPTDMDVVIRTAHTFVGTWVLALSVVMLLLVRRATK